MQRDIVLGIIVEEFHEIYELCWHALKQDRFEERVFLCKCHFFKFIDHEVPLIVRERSNFTSTGGFQGPSFVPS